MSFFAFFNYCAVILIDSQAIPKILQIVLFSGHWANIWGGIQTNLLSELPKHLFLCIHTKVTFGRVLQILEGKIIT